MYLRLNLKRLYYYLALPATQDVLSGHIWNYFGLKIEQIQIPVQMCSLLTKALKNECIHCKEFDNDQKKGNLEKVQIIKSIIGLLMGLRGHMPPSPRSNISFTFMHFPGKIGLKSAPLGWYPIPFEKSRVQH